jgi:UDP-2-acetamido-3-amino-2,3-dideoxy-glucuronate N-acetyltransferase
MARKGSGDLAQVFIDPTATIHPTAMVHPTAVIGPGSRVWHAAHIREEAHIGAECVIGQNVYIDYGVAVGDRVKIQNNASVYHGVTLEDGVFIGPHVCFCNDVVPRAITPEGALKSQDDWTVGPVIVRSGASIGAGAVILPNVIVGAFAMVGAGAVVTRSVPDHALVYGNPARQQGYVCRCGHRLVDVTRAGDEITGRCSACARICVFGAPPVEVGIS